MTKGIVIVAVKNPIYGRMAFNLALTIKATEDFPVTVLHNGRGLSHLNDKQKSVFDEMIEIPEEIGGVEAKLHLCTYTPYARTLYIDADNVWLPKKKPSDLFAELEGQMFTAITEGKYDIDKGVNELSKVYTMWGDLMQIIEKHELSGVLRQFRTEVMYFEKCPDVIQLFEDGKSVYRDPKVVFTSFADSVPDEFAFNIAACKLNIKPHVYRWQPAYWYPLSGRFLPEHQLYQKYWILSTGGNGTTPWVKLLYDNIVKAACKKLGFQFLFTLQPKRLSLKERRKL